MTTHTLPILMAWGLCPPDWRAFEAGLIHVINVAADALAKFGAWLVDPAAYRGIL